jgi:competence protein ComEC
MKLLDYVPIKLAIGLVVGVLAGPYLPWPSLLLNILLIAGLTSMAYLHFFRKRTSAAFGYLTAITVFFLGVTAQQRTQPKHQPDHYIHFIEKETPTVHLKIREVLKPTKYNNRYIAQVLSVENHKTSGKIVLRLSKNNASDRYSVDEELIALSDILPLQFPLNPHQFNYPSFMARQGIHHQITLNTKHVIVLDDGNTTLWGRAAQIRNQITEKLAQAGFKDDELAVVQALLLGDRNDISGKTYDDYKNAGAVHILALSGLHIGILLFIINFLLRPLGLFTYGRQLKLLLSVILLWGFAFLAGLSPSIIRACTMFSFVAYAIYLNRPSSSFNILALSILFILLFIDPNLIFQVGFQMSYAAVFAIVGLYPLFQKIWFPKNNLLRYIWQLFTVSIAAQLGVLPISLLYFHQFPGLFFVSNLLLIPFMGIILGLGILVIALALTHLLPDLLAQIFRGCITLMNQVVSWVATQESFVFKAISFDEVQVVLFYAIVLSLGSVLAKPLFKRILIFLIAILGLQIWTYYQNLSAAKKSSLIIAHDYGNTLLLDRLGRQLTIMGDAEGAENLIQDIAIGERIDHIFYAPLENSYTYNNIALMIIDSSGVFLPKKKVDILLLTSSPKINLDRVVNALKPKTVIADGSNYPSSVLRWRHSCSKKNISFYHTAEVGALQLDISGRLMNVAH